MTKHEIAAHERLETIVKKEARIQEKRDERAQRRMRKMRKKKEGAPSMRAHRFRTAAKEGRIGISESTFFSDPRRLGLRNLRLSIISFSLHPFLSIARVKVDFLFLGSRLPSKRSTVFSNLDLGCKSSSNPWLSSSTSRLLNRCCSIRRECVGESA